MPAPAAGGLSLGNMAMAGLGFAGDLFGSGEDPDYANYWNLRNNEWNQNFSMLQRQDALNQFGVIRAADERNFWANREQETWQRDNDLFNRNLATNQLQIRTADARLAGLHPLVAAGLNPASGPSGSFGGYGGTPTPSTGGSPVPMNEMRGKHGQNIMSAIARNFTKREKAEERRDALADAYTAANIKKTEAETAYWLSETARNNVNGSVGRPDNSPKRVTGKIDNMGGTVVASEVQKKYKNVQAGLPAEVQFKVSPDGTYVPYPSESAADAMDIDGIVNLPAISWSVRNAIAPNFMQDFSSQRKNLPPARKGYAWHWSHKSGGWREYKIGSWGDRVWWMR